MISTLQFPKWKINICDLYDVYLLILKTCEETILFQTIKSDTITILRHNTFYFINWKNKPWDTLVVKKKTITYVKPCIIVI